MRNSTSFIAELCKRYPPPNKPNSDFTDKDIAEFEKALGTELPSDYYEFLKLYGYGSFNDYFYINYPFTENGAEIFISENEERKEDYDFLELDSYNGNGGVPLFVDCKFVDGELTVTAGNAELAEFLRAEKIDAYTRSKITALGDHYPYDFYPEDGGLIFIGYTDDEEFFLRFSDGKESIVMYSEGYYEFNMSFSEFVYGYLTQKIKLPMQLEDNSEWEFCVYS